MKKLSFIASVLLASAALMTSCNDKDNPVIEEPKTVIELDGQQYETDKVATLMGEVGQEITLTIGVYDRYDIYGVDFGDGVIVADTVCFENGGLRDEDGAEVVGTTHKNSTVFTGTVAGDGTVKVYGNSDIWMLSVSGNAIPASFGKAMNERLQQLYLSGLNVDGIDFSNFPMLTALSMNNSPVASIDISKNTELTSLSIICTPQSEYDPQLESIDVSNNPKLESINLGSSFYKPGKLTSIDLSKNQALKTIVIGNNKLQSITLPEGAEVSQLSLEQNELEELDLSVLASLKNIQVNNNKIKSLDLSMLQEKSIVTVNDNELTSLEIPVDIANLYAQNNKISTLSIKEFTASSPKVYLQNNNLTLATLPVKSAKMTSDKKIKNYTYAPQAPLAVDEEVTELDLSEQLTAQGILDAPATTAYSFVTAGGTALVEGTDYKVTAPGKFKFVKAQSEKVYGVMANAGFPLFTGDNAFKTTEFTVKAAAAAGQTWNFTVWSAATVANLKADAAASKTEGWSDVEKKADAEADADPTDISKDNCFWLQGTVGADGSLSANGQVIEELKGLKFDPDYAAKRSLAIAVNYPEANVSSGFGPYAGPAYLWLGGGGSKQACPCFTIPGVKAGQKLTVVMESHKVTDARGIQIYANSYDAANQIGAAFKPTAQDTYTWTIDQDCDVVVWNTSGCHIYTMTVE